MGQTNATPRRALPLRLLAGIAVWLVVVASGFGALMAYQMRAGEPARAPGDWPEHAGLRFDPSRYNLVMFVHPLCPCSDASLEQLNQLLAREGGGISATVCVVDLDEADPKWADTSLVRQARAIGPLKTVIDLRGRVASQFGASTSGQVLLYDPHGHRVFAGGITPWRGHVGDSSGYNLVRDIVRGASSGPAQAPVYGCSFVDAGEGALAFK